jgi:hypothetical protein
MSFMLGDILVQLAVCDWPRHILRPLIGVSERYGPRQEPTDVLCDVNPDGRLRRETEDYLHALPTEPLFAYLGNAVKIRT